MLQIDSIFGTGPVDIEKSRRVAVGAPSSTTTFSDQMKFEPLGEAKFKRDGAACVAGSTVTDAATVEIPRFFPIDLGEVKGTLTSTQTFSLLSPKISPHLQSRIFFYYVWEARRRGEAGSAVLFTFVAVGNSRSFGCHGERWRARLRNSCAPAAILGAESAHHLALCSCGSRNSQFATENPTPSSRSKSHTMQ